MRTIFLTLSTALALACGAGTESPLVSDDTRLALDEVLRSADVPGVVAVVVDRDGVSPVPARHIVVDAGVAGVEVPEQHVEEGKIILNLSYAATSGLRLGNELIEFEARFAGVARNVSIPVQGVLGIYAHETGQGMIFTEEDTRPAPPEGDLGGELRRGHLKVVK